MISPQPHLVRRGQGTPVLFVHGNGVDHRLLLPLDEAVAASGAWTRLHLDLPGFGATSALPGRGSAQDLAEWLGAAVDDLVGDESFAVVANSFGGLLARNLVHGRREQVLGMALLCPVVQPERARRRLPPRSVVVRDQGLLERLEESDRAEFESVAVVQDEEGWRRFRDAALPGLRAYDRDANARLMARYAVDVVPESCGTYDAPVLIVAGRQDAVVGWEDQRDLASAYPRSTLAILDGAGHNAHLDRPEVVEALLIDWLGVVSVTARGGLGPTGPTAPPRPQDPH